MAGRLATLVSSFEAVIRPAGVLVLMALLASALPATAATPSTPTDAIALGGSLLPDVLRAVPMAGLGGTLAVTLSLPSDTPADETPRPRRAPRSDRTVLHLVRTLSGGMAPKSVVAAPMGRVFAMNVMYGHSITVFDRRFRRLKTISDEVPRSFLRLRSMPDERVRGAPVEAALSTDGTSLFVSQYSMYGPGFWEPGYDHCAEGDVIDRSYVYRIDVQRLRKVAAYRVGEVPKFLAASPDGRTLLVANWCSMDVSVVDLERGKQVARIPIGLNPRGIAFSPDGAKAYVSVVGERRIAVIDMARRKVKRWFDQVGVRPRHLVMAPTGRYLYVSVEGLEVQGLRDGSVLKLDPATGRVLGRLGGLQEPRTAIVAPDGRALYVVDYLAGRLLKIDTSSMRLLQSVRLGYHPIGVTYDALTRRVWVAGYGGTVWVLAERRR
jgi:YVTN family beta-propeller protein